MKEVKLTKSQIAIFTGLAMQKNELQKQFQDIIEAENEQIELLVKHYNLEAGEYKIAQDDSSGIYLRQTEINGIADNT